LIFFSEVEPEDHIDPEKETKIVEENRLLEKKGRLPSKEIGPDGQVFDRRDGDVMPWNPVRLGDAQAIVGSKRRTIHNEKRIQAEGKKRIVGRKQSFREATRVRAHTHDGIEVSNQASDMFVSLKSFTSVENFVDVNVDLTHEKDNNGDLWKTEPPSPVKEEPETPSSPTVDDSVQNEDVPSYRAETR